MIRILATTKQFSVWLAIVGLLCGGSPTALAQEKGEGPVSLFITYKCPPETRAAFRAYMGGPGIEQFLTWKNQGIIDDYLVLFSSFTHSATAMPDMMARIEFAEYIDLVNWKEIERTRPAGMTAAAMDLCKPHESHLADLTWEGGTAKAQDSVYIRVPVHFKGSKAEYGTYFESYVKPQYDKWVQAGVLSWWGAYHNHLRQGDVWDLLVIYEYKDLPGLARRDLVKQSARAILSENPQWLELHQEKLDLRWSEQAIIMDVIFPAQ